MGPAPTKVATADAAHMASAAHMAAPTSMTASATTTSKGYRHCRTTEKDGGCGYEQCFSQHRYLHRVLF
jgi:uncharacterized low-complexity protein